MRWFITSRYLFSHKRQSLVCTAGVTISVTMFIAMTALMKGGVEKFIQETVGSSGHITIKDEPRESHTPILERAYPNPDSLLAMGSVKPRNTVRKIKNSTGLLRTLEAMPGMEAAAPEVFGEVIATYGTRTVNLSVEGIEPERQVRVTTIGDDVLEGSFHRLRTVAAGVVLGKGVADTLGAGLEDSITLASSFGGRTTARVVGIFRTGVISFDYSRGYMLLNDAQTLLDKKNIVNEIVIRTDDYTWARQYAAQIEGLCGYRTESWQEQNDNFLKIFDIQTLVTYIVTGALLIVAAFGVLNILIMAVLERVNDIAILRSFGLSRWDIGIIYTLQGGVIGVVGAALGLGFGKLTIEGLRRLPITLEGIIRTEGFLMSESAGQYVLAFVISVLVVLFASVYPAWRAAQYDPVEVIRGAH